MPPRQGAHFTHLSRVRPVFPACAPTPCEAGGGFRARALPPVQPTAAPAAHGWALARGLPTGQGATAGGRRPIARGIPCFNQPRRCSWTSLAIFRSPSPPRPPLDPTRHDRLPRRRPHAPAGAAPRPVAVLRRPHGGRKGLHEDGHRPAGRREGVEVGPWSSDSVDIVNPSSGEVVLPKMRRPARLYLETSVELAAAREFQMRLPDVVTAASPSSRQSRRAAGSRVTSTSSTSSARAPAPGRRASTRTS